MIGIHGLRARFGILCLFILFCANNINGQDAHFSQFYAAPLVLNPALAGTSGGTYRVNVNYRDQWRSALDNPLRTFSASGDYTINLQGNKGYGDVVGGGFMFYSDQVGDFDLNTNEIAMVASFQKSLDYRAPHYIGAGVKMGLFQRSINYEDLNFGDEFNAIDSYNLPTGELLPANNVAFVDFSLGINYVNKLDRKLNYYAGLAYHHISTPNASFYASERNVDPELVTENALFAKLTGYVGVNIETNIRTQVQPRILFLNQGPHTEVNLGTNFRYRFLKIDGRAVHFGPWLRMVNNENGFGLESIVATIGMELNNLIIGFSYDHNISDLVSDRQGLNALEISITYKGEYDSNENFCPEF